MYVYPFNKMCKVLHCLSYIDSGVTICKKINWQIRNIDISYWYYILFGIETPQMNIGNLGPFLRIHVHIFMLLYIQNPKSQYKLNRIKTDTLPLHSLPDPPQMQQPPNFVPRQDIFKEGGGGLGIAYMKEKKKTEKFIKQI